MRTSYCSRPIWYAPSWRATRGVAVLGWSTSPRTRTGAGPPRGSQLLHGPLGDIERERSRPDLAEPGYSLDIVARGRGQHTVVKVATAYFGRKGSLDPHDKIVVVGWADRGIASRDQRVDLGISEAAPLARPAVLWSRQGLSDG